VNWEQVKAIVWLRWRLTRNGMARAGAVNAVLSMFFLVALLVGGIAAGVGGFLAGWLALGKADPQVLLMVWDGAVLFFLVIWLSGLMVEIQRSESIDLAKLLHLPVTLQQVFVFNYVASHLTPAILLLLPAMMGLCAGLVLGVGLRMFLLPFLVLGFIFMITAWTYCLRGWLAALMVNKRRRRAIIVWVTLVLILLSQLPNFVVNSRLFHAKRQVSSGQWRPAARGEQAGPGLPVKILQAHLVVPPGWVGYGAMSMAERNPWPGLGAAAACGLLGSLGLMRAYRMTLRFYQGADVQGETRVARQARTGARKPLLVEWRLPWLPDDTAALALASFRSLSRAPELKMAFIMPLVMILALGSAQFTRPQHALPHYWTAFAATAAAVVAAFSFAQAMGNAFGLDRNGFRALVLLPTRRHHILLAKNLSLFPFVAGVGLLLLSLAKLLLGISWFDFLAGLLQVPLAFLLFSLTCNLLAILVPYRLSQSTLQAKKPKPIVFFAVFLSMLALPIVMSPTLIPPGFQLLWSLEGWAPWLPVNLVLTVLLLAGVGALYRGLLPMEGRLLQRREQAILKEVTEEVE
jgi:ABC-2 type transport system permease protein